MHRDLLQFLNCPARDCGASELSLEARAVEEIEYRTDTVEEVRAGAILCAACGRSYPVEGYVPSFEQLFPEELQEEAQYWGDWYGFFWERGYRGFYDLREPVAHFIARGIEVPDPATLSGNDLPGTHEALANHPLVREAERVLDVGCGGGWSSLFLARRGHKVVAFDPSAANVRRAKQHAISQGEYIEYLGTGLGFLSFKPGLFDAVFALHSIHHVPDLGNEMRIMREWMKEGAPIAVDEHIQTDPILSSIVGQLDEWFTREVAPRHKTLSDADMASLPVAAHSRLEGTGSNQVLSALADNFSIESFQARFVSLDLFTFMYYLWRGCDPEVVVPTSQGVARIYDFLQSAFPERTEYVSVLGRKADTPGPARAALLNARPKTIEQVEKTDERAANAESAVEVLQATVEELNSTIHSKDEHIAGLEGIIATQQEELVRSQETVKTQAELLERIESGRLMRLAGRVTGKR